MATGFGLQAQVVEEEQAACPDDSRKALVSKMFELPFERVELEWADVERAAMLRALGFKEYDAFHLAASERGKCDVVLTTDDRLIARARRIRAQLKVAVYNPVDWLLEHFT